MNYHSIKQLLQTSSVLLPVNPMRVQLLFRVPRFAACLSGDAVHDELLRCVFAATRDDDGAPVGGVGRGRGGVGPPSLHIFSYGTHMPTSGDRSDGWARGQAAVITARGCRPTRGFYLSEGGKKWVEWKKRRKKWQSEIQ